VPLCRDEREHAESCTDEYALLFAIPLCTHGDILHGLSAAIRLMT
jgi:hypothetical protein